MMAKTLLVYFTFNILFSYYSISSKSSFPYTCKSSDIGESIDCSKAEKEEVCGWFNENIQCFVAPCAVTSTSICEACKDENVEKVTKFSCNSPVNKQYLKRMYCDEKSKKNTMCIEIYQPVCGYSEENCEGKKCMKTYSNSCFACSNKDVLYYIEGEKCEITSENKENESIN